MATNESKLLDRMGDLTSEPKRMLPPILGYDQKSLVTLEQSVQPLISLVPHVEHMVWTVQQNCQHPPDHLSPDESASIMLYTLEWMPREFSFYFILNRTLRSRNRQELLPWFLYLHLLMVALSKLPSATYRMIFRGIKMDISEDFPEEVEPSLSTPLISHTATSTYQNKQLQQLLEQCEQKSKVNLDRQNLNDEDMEIVVREAIVNKQCKKLDLLDNKITSVGASIIATALNNNSTLESLYIPSNRLGDAGVEALTKIFSLNNCVVRSLDLRDCGITDKGAEYIAQILKKNTTLRNLPLDWNEMTDRGVELLSTILTHHNHTLRAIGFSNQKLVSDASVDGLVEMLKYNQELSRLDIDKCNLSENGKERLRQSVQSKKDFHLTV